MTSSLNTDTADRLKDILGYDDSSEVEVAIESPSEIDDEPENTGNISLSDFHKKPNFNLWIIGGATALIFSFLGFFVMNQSSESVATQPDEKKPDLVDLKPEEDERIGKLKTQVALSDQEQAMRSPTSIANTPPSSDRASSRRPPDRPAASEPAPSPPPVMVSRSAPPPPPVQQVAYRAPVRSYREVPPPLAIRTVPRLATSPQVKQPLKANPVSYQFGVPQQNGSGISAPSSGQSATIPPNYQVYYSNGDTEGPDAPLPNYSQPVSPSSSLYASAASLPVSIPSAPSRSSAEQRFLEGRPIMRSVPVGTQIFAKIFQATAVDSAQGYKVLLRVSKPLVDEKGNQAIPEGTLIGATLQIGGGGVANVVPEVLYIKERAIPLPQNTMVVALRDGNPLVAERIERGGDRPGTNLMGLIVDTGATFLPMLSSGGGGDSFRDYYQFQRVTDYTNRNFGGGGNDRANYSQRQVSQSSVYFKLPPNLEVQLLVVAPFELPL